MTHTSLAEHLPQAPKEVRTERLLLRSARAGDGEALHEAIAVSLSEFFPWLPFSAELGDLATMEQVSVLGQEEFAKGESFVWRVFEPDDTMVGSVDLHAFNLKVPSCEVGYWTRSDRMGMGYAREFVTCALEIAQRQLGFTRIVARCDERNERSWRFAESLGFKLEGLAIKDHRDASGELNNTKLYALLCD